jgi:RsiW-degrading membrane proteinase PrsW (M82 family)
VIREENDNNQPAIDIIRTAASGFFFSFFLKSLKQETIVRI